MQVLHLYVEEDIREVNVCVGNSKRTVLFHFHDSPEGHGVITGPNKDGPKPVFLKGSEKKNVIETEEVYFKGGGGYSLVPSPSGMKCPCYNMDGQYRKEIEVVQCYR